MTRLTFGLGRLALLACVLVAGIAGSRGRLTHWHVIGRAREHDDRRPRHEHEWHTGHAHGRLRRERDDRHRRRGITTAYNGYGWELQWDDATLDFSSNTENSAGHGGTLCAAVTTTTSPGDGVPPGKSGPDREPAVSVRRDDDVRGEPGDGYHPVRSRRDDRSQARDTVRGSIFGSTFFAGGGAPMSTAYTDASLTCGAPGGYADVHKHADEYRDPTITNTPTDTATPTHTPTVTNTPTRHADAGHADPANA